MANVPVRVIVENLSPEGEGSILSPTWVGFHDGGFDTYDGGRPASPGVQRLAEDGNPAALVREFGLGGFGTVDGVVGDGPILPGQAASQSFVLDNESPDSHFFNYASMIVPSNDAWIGNGDEKEYRVFNNRGQFQPISFVVTGDAVLDAGTEVNDERPKTTVGLAQTEPNTGEFEIGVVLPHPGYRGSVGNPEGRQGILRGDFGDFTADNYQVARISIAEEKTGNNRNNLLNGTKRTDSFNGGGGNDNINGRGGSDFIAGGTGNDNLQGSVGKDTLDGDGGNDMVDGGAGMDLLMGCAGMDLLMGGLTRNNRQTFKRTFKLEEAQEVPPVANTRATGTVTATLDGMELTIEGNFEKLTSAPAAAHIHFGAEGFNGGVVQGLTLEGNRRSGTLSGSLTLTPEQLAAVLADNYYINLHTENNPGGELRGQIDLNLKDAVPGGDKLMGESGVDVLIGSVGDDILDGGVGDDTLTGLDGRDTFVIAEAGGSDLILDYQDGRDKIGLADGLRFRDLIIEQGTSDDAASIESVNHALIKSGDNILGVVAFTSAEDLNSRDFMTV